MRELRTTMFFSVQDQVGALDECLHALKAANVSMTRIESRPSKVAERGYDFFVDIDVRTKEVVECVVEEIKRVKIVRDVRIVSSLGALGSRGGGEGSQGLDQQIVQKAKEHRSEQPLPHIDYTEQEKDTWRQVYTRLRDMYPKYACCEFLHVLPLLEQNCTYGPDNISQIEDISRFLKDCTGFTLRPVMGLLTPRDFLNSLAFRVFHSTQYIRHHSDPYYTPEPDCCHKLLGHVPLFADPSFAELVQEVELA
ncbi:hypothetical protein GGH96_006159 [Coemansia sp. RSA 1972]|nr:hypothetical protein GGH96_006159 [Coemansia sp. RSA 1972]